MSIDLSQIIAVNRGRLGLDPIDTARDQKFSLQSGASHRLCVYGLMGPDGPDAHVLKPYGGTWADVTFPGYIQNAGACLINGECPGLAWTPTGEQNSGHVLDAAALADAWLTLDAHEGNDLVRLLTPVQMSAGGASFAANIYASRDASRAQLLMLDGMNVHDDADFRL